MPTYDQVPMEQMNFAFVSDDVDHDSLIDLNIGCGWKFCRPEAHEIELFRPLVLKACALKSMPHPIQEYSFTVKKSGISFKHEPSMDKWRYGIFKPENSDALEGAKLSEALRLIEADLTVELWSILDRDGAVKIGGTPARYMRTLNEFNVNHVPKIINADEAVEVMKLRAELDEDVYPSIARAIGRVREMDVHSETDLKQLGYFGILEMLLTHSPKPNDSADSITRQLKRNLTLLDNRMSVSCKIGLSEFKGVDSGSVISHLYGYRSAIAHGSSPTKDLLWLWNKRPDNLEDPYSSEYFAQAWLSDFLRRTVRRVLVQAMREPQLVVDLKG